MALQEGISLEHLVFDAGSTDSSSEVAARFPNIQWVQESDSGMSEAINKGFTRAKGTWIMWLNADDRLKPGILARILPILNSNTNDVIYGSWNFISKEGSIIREVKAPRWSRFVHIHHHCYIGSTACFLRKSSIVDEGFRLREDFQYVMDGEFYARLDRGGKTFSAALPLIADFRLHGQNASQRHLAIDAGIGKVLEAEKQHSESRAIRRVYGITLFSDPYLNGLMDGVFWLAARLWKQFLKFTT